ncbi:hypothetical protein [Dactylosporangium sp. CA-092794]|uniref:hypothetical protein n=1 Tax=Dactylosporangium sp. CA-092794 TaxID=3239929 RepID=UPI003D8B15C6
MHRLPVSECRDAEVVVGPPDDVDGVLAGLFQVRGEARQTLAERAVNVHRHADRLQRFGHRDGAGGERGAGRAEQGTSGQRVVHIP